VRFAGKKKDSFASCCVIVEPPATISPSTHIAFVRLADALPSRSRDVREKVESSAAISARLR
jgi:hypothetical protein